MDKLLIKFSPLKGYHIAVYSNSMPGCSPLTPPPHLDFKPRSVTPWSSHQTVLLSAFIYFASQPKLCGFTWQIFLLLWKKDSKLHSICSIRLGLDPLLRKISPTFIHNLVGTGVLVCLIRPHFWSFWFRYIVIMVVVETDQLRVLFDQVRSSLLKTWTT